MLEALGAFLLSIFAVLVSLPLLPFAVPLLFEWIRAPAAPDLETA